MSDDKSKNLYDQRNIDTLELVYGRGYLSAGGDEEVARVLAEFDLNGRRILDLGCGLGGASVCMTRDLGAPDVVGFDIDEVVLERARLLVEENHVEDRVRLIHGEPGPLQFPDESFDIVYMTAVACHMNELEEFFRGIVRVIRPGGWLLGSDWILRQKNQAFHDWDKLLRERGLNFYFVDQSDFSTALKSAGLEQIRFNDRTRAFTDFSAVSSERVATELKPGLLSSLGEEGYQDIKDWTDVRYAGLNQGGMLYQQFYAQKGE